MRSSTEDVTASTDNQEIWTVCKAAVLRHVPEQSSAAFGQDVTVLTAGTDPGQAIGSVEVTTSGRTQMRFACALTRQEGVWQVTQVVFSEDPVQTPVPRQRVAKSGATLLQE